ncbi:beta-1,4-N-acetylglucosamine oligosaccharide 3-O-carbamoyltransferase NolO [Paraburkholderia sp. BL23I1N1]|uniref:Nodulation protein n=1 Tax=Paraburkholderia dipogonis TaxID=1211383 RepID=A0A4Y8MGT5_9BURK|nr:MULTISPECIES: carbamoyltransferase [Paraburkholderia]REE18460.1 beta-1,4-N-acetylglucosamine oligosaccharide 3-O-carbamoyltransferase NolO [Paraburkholderia sp. BL27I4N3]RKE35474.1 beta-1,4-N-acetylglucosamine oligosaccharide 3-O-carbamoyltransferase NolO [Paraburkholderia sp. BL23I1N1]RKR31407.1 beta-1,4-N-acetylglucosamine oligosaccharide 3-O-carbamoyltransferase NolO [Paraburkholderia sp. BL17N1]TCK94542.1 beta-1,4-N-acetylglucosamine oligosaccharide 3-O-carbamoyltransferase NolO [Parabur
MLCLGVSGGLDKVHENPLELPNTFLHDGAAVLVRDGRVIAAVEEERLNRIKHSNKFPSSSIQYCLASAGIQLSDIDRIAFYATEAYCNVMLERLFLSQPNISIPVDAKLFLRKLLMQEFGTEVDPSRVSFVSHHLAHAVSAFAMSGFEQSLILAVDGGGDFLSGLLALGSGTEITQLATFAEHNSLGLFYLETIRYLGYGLFDEYKVMGLAPYGDPAPYRGLFEQFYQLSADGEYRVYLDRIGPTLLRSIQVRRKGMPFTQQHRDVAASLQEALERIVFHILRHHREVTGMKRLCIAGGVAHNCTMNGKLLYSGLFEDIFVQPAAHDAGCALGAALMMSNDFGQPAPRERLQEVYWGPDLGSDLVVEQELNAWAGHLDVERSDDVAGRAADWMANGAVIGWVQGRSEFGPRALGNRSILADPRPTANKDRINAMVKKREGYRPFAPSVLEDDAHEFFDLPEGTREFPFMNFVVRVRDSKRALLGAITHIDGTARLQTVSRKTNPAYWEVINAFKKRTGIPILLNTSFNNNAEPIVDSVADAIATYLTTELDGLVVGPFLVKKRPATQEHWTALAVSLPPYASLYRIRAHTARDRQETVCEIRTGGSICDSVRISHELFDMLMQIEGEAVLGHLLDTITLEQTRRETLVKELRGLWEQRRVRLHPSRALSR